jgi:predicted amidohydrolase
MRIALAQTDSTLGEVDANLEMLREQVARADEHHADLTVFPELAVHGYWLGQLPEDRSLSATDPRLTGLASGGCDVLVGFHEDGGVRRYNSAGYLSRSAVVHVHRKLYLSNYLVWEERKHASPGQSVRAFDTDHGRVATLICNDAWQPPIGWLAAQDGAELLLIPANSAAHLGPDSLDTIAYWEQLLAFLARMLQAWVVFVNRVGSEGGSDFWGGSRVLDPHGQVVAQAPLWEPSLTVVDIDINAARRCRLEIPLLAEARLGLIERETQRLIQDGGDA